VKYSNHAWKDFLGVHGVVADYDEEHPIVSRPNYVVRFPGGVFRSTDGVFKASELDASDHVFPVWADMVDTLRRVAEVEGSETSEVVADFFDHLSVKAIIEVPEIVSGLTVQEVKARLVRAVEDGVGMGAVHGG
jgi:hypothetical protein